MLISTRQAGQILGLSVGSVAYLIRHGRLTNHAPNKAPKAHKLVDEREVREYKKTMAPPRQSVAPVPVLAAGPGQIMQALARIEAKLDALVTAFS